MEGCLEGITDEIRISYLDDVIVYSKTFEKQVENLRTVLRQLRKHGVKLKPSKCSLFLREVCFLGRIVNHSGHTIDPRNTVVVTKLRDSNPKTVGDVRTLTGLLSIKQFSRTAKPLWKLVGSWEEMARKYEGKVKIIKDEEASIILWPCQLDKWTPGSSRPAYQYNYQSSGNGSPWLHASICPPHWCVGTRFRSSAVPQQEGHTYSSWTKLPSSLK